MGIIYVLQKEVPGLGRLTKVGMTTRSGEDRAAEYGGGGWDVIDEMRVSTDDPIELQEIEGRIHDRLDEHRCGAAAGFGLTEVFTCSADEALAAARAEIGSQAGGADQVERLRRRTNKLIERKVVQTHASAVARLHMDKYEKPKDSWGIKRQYGVPLRTPEKELAEWLIHKKALEALDKIAAEAVTFRAMLKGDMDALEQQWSDRQRDEEYARAKRLREVEEARLAQAAHGARTWSHDPKERSLLRSELAAHVGALKSAEQRLKAYGWLIGGSLVVSAIFIIVLIGALGTPGSTGELYLLILLAAAAGGSGAAVGFYGFRRGRLWLAERRRLWDEAHPD